MYLDLHEGNAITERSFLNVTGRSIATGAKGDEVKCDAVSAVKAHELMSPPPGISVSEFF